MLQLILASLGFVPWVIYIIVTYYSKNFSQIDHIESATGFGGYLASMGFIYLIYKVTSTMMHSKKVKFSFWHLTGFSFLHLLIVSIVYTGAQVTTGSPFFGIGGASSFVLFGHITSLLIYPLFLVFLWRSIGYSILKWIKGWDEILLRIRIGAEISIGLLIFSSGLLILGFFHVFTITGLMILCGVLTIIAIPGWIITYSDIKNKYIEFDQHEGNSESLIGFMNPRLITAEFAFLVVSFLISVSLINAIRPMPIGWDDLGVYMNFPRIMAITGELLQGAGMYTWQLVTGSGFLLDQIAANAFYVNQLGGILSMIILTSILSVIFERKDQKFLLSLPLLLAGIYYMMPMTIFQQAKDMKLDPALMMVSVSAFGILWYALRERFEKKGFYWLIAIVGIISGLAFGIKITTLILIIASIALISYRILGIYGFLGFFFLFLGIFTGANLWSKMNVWMPVENVELIRNITIVCGSLGLLSFIIKLGIDAGKKNILAYITFGLIYIISVFASIGTIILLIYEFYLIFMMGFTVNYSLMLIITIFILGGSIVIILWQRKNYPSFNTWIIANLTLILGIILALTPWFIKNGYEAKTFTQNQKYGVIDGLLSGYAGVGYDNYSSIYSTEEFTKKRKDQQALSITSDGKSQNEDFSRYFGQESGLNNYLKLPVNLTFQKNQSGEFTEITYIFFAFLPAILLFIRGRKYGKYTWTSWIFPILVGIGMTVMILYYFISSTGILFTGLMSNITLPLGYAYIIGGVLGSIIISHYFISDDSEGTDIKNIIIMLMIYGFLFLISAFGIVWYGVFVYFLFLVLIGLASHTFVSYNEREDNEDLIGIKVTLSILFFLFIFVYIIRSAFPHGWNNLVNSGMNEFKYNKLDQNESIFTYRTDYVTSIAAMNVVDPMAVTKRASALARSATIKKILTPERIENMSPADLHQILLYFITQIESGKLSQDKKSIETDIENIGHELYSSILSPKGADINKKGIYRIGTFMTYLINNNRSRYLDDSLVFDFETFFYDPSPEKTIDRMKKVGLGYLLTDLNAATIDRDPRRVLTTRFEHLLLTMRAKNLKLIDTDNLCLQVALGEYKAGKLQTDTEFIDIAGTNSESYRGPNMKVVYRNEKQNKCATYIIKMINDSSKNNTPLPSYLTPIRDGLIKAANNPTEQQNVITRALGQSYFALFEIQDIPLESITPIPVIGTGSTNSGKILSGQTN